MTSFLTRIFRRLRGLGTCPECGDATVYGECSACIGIARLRAEQSRQKVQAENQLLRCENQMLSRRLMSYEIKAVRAKRDE